MAQRAVRAGDAAALAAGGSSCAAAIIAADGRSLVPEAAVGSEGGRFPPPLPATGSGVKRTLAESMTEAVAAAGPIDVEPAVPGWYLKYCWWVPWDGIKRLAARFRLQSDLEAALGGVAPPPLPAAAAAAAVKGERKAPAPAEEAARKAAIAAARRALDLAIDRIEIEIDDRADERDALLDIVRDLNRAEEAVRGASSARQALAGALRRHEARMQYVDIAAKAARRAAAAVPGAAAACEWWSSERFASEAAAKDARGSAKAAAAAADGATELLAAIRTAGVGKALWRRVDPRALEMLRGILAPDCAIDLPRTAAAAAAAKERRRIVPHASIGPDPKITVLLMRYRGVLETCSVTRPHGRAARAAPASGGGQSAAEQVAVRSLANFLGDAEAKRLVSPDNEPSTADTLEAKKARSGGGALGWAGAGHRELPAHLKSEGMPMYAHRTTARWRVDFGGGKVVPNTINVARFSTSRDPRDDDAVLAAVPMIVSEEPVKLESATARDPRVLDRIKESLEFLAGCWAAPSDAAVEREAAALPMCARLLMCASSLGVGVCAECLAPLLRDAAGSDVALGLHRIAQTPGGDGTSDARAKIDAPGESCSKTAWAWLGRTGGPHFDAPLANVADLALASVALVACDGGALAAAMRAVFVADGAGERTMARESPDVADAIAALTAGAPPGRRGAAPPPAARAVPVRRADAAKRKRRLKTGLTSGMRDDDSSGSESEDEDHVELIGNGEGRVDLEDLVRTLDAFEVDGAAVAGAGTRARAPVPAPAASGGAGAPTADGAMRTLRDITVPVEAMRLAALFETTPELAVVYGRETRAEAARLERAAINQQQTVTVKAQEAWTNMDKEHSAGKKSDVRIDAALYSRVPTAESMATSELAIDLARVAGTGQRMLHADEAATAMRDVLIDKKPAIFSTMDDARQLRCVNRALKELAPAESKIDGDYATSLELVATISRASADAVERWRAELVQSAERAEVEKAVGEKTAELAEAVGVIEANRSEFRRVLSQLLHIRKAGRKWECAFERRDSAAAPAVPRSGAPGGSGTAVATAVPTTKAALPRYVAVVRGDVRDWIAELEPARARLDVLLDLQRRARGAEQQVEAVAAVLQSLVVADAADPSARKGANQEDDLEAATDSERSDGDEQ